MSCEDDVEQQEMEDDKVGKEEELGLGGCAKETNQDNAEYAGREEEGERERE